MQILSLPAKVQVLVQNGSLSLDKAASLARLPDEDKQLEMANKAIKHRLSPSELQREVAVEAGTEGTHRVLSYFVTPQKFSAKTGEFLFWLKRASPQLQVETTTNDEQVLMLSAIASLENQLGKIKTMIMQRKSSRRKKA